MPEKLEGIGHYGGPRVLRKLISHRAAALGAVIIVVVFLTSVFAPWVAPRDPLAVDLARRHSRCKIR